MKIKVKKEMKLDELIKWARENPGLSKGKKFFTTGNGDGIVRFQKDTNDCTPSVRFDEGGGVGVDDVVSHSNYITSHLIVWCDVASGTDKR